MWQFWFQFHWNSNFFKKELEPKEKKNIESTTKLTKAAEGNLNLTDYQAQEKMLENLYNKLN